MKHREWFYRTDYWVQTVLGSGILLMTISFVGLFFALWGTFVIGAWQMLSALLRIVVWRDTTENWRMYLGAAVFYLILGYLLLKINVDDLLLFVFYMIGALVIGFWHYSMVRSSYYHPPFDTPESAPDILDDQIF